MREASQSSEVTAAISLHTSKHMKESSFPHHFASLWESSDRAERYKAQLLDFMEAHVYPAEPVYHVQMRESGNPHHHPQIVEDLKARGAAPGFVELFHPSSQWGPGLTNLECAPLAEIMGRSPLLAPEACNCNAPDTGNMELLTLFGTDEHKQRWLRPLLEGTIRSAFAMTEPAVANSDATNIELRTDRAGDGYLLNGRSGLPPMRCMRTAKC